MTAALTADDVGRTLALRGRSPGIRVRAMYRAGKFPPPIDPTLPVVSWRWSPRIVEQYIDGQAAA